MRALAIISMLLLMPVLSYGYACVTYQDCPAAACAGSVRQCVDNICRPTPCLVPREADLEREHVESFSDAVRPFEQGINLSYRSKNPGGIKSSIIGALGLNSILIVFLKAVAVIFAGIIIATFIMLLRVRGIVKIAIIILTIILGAAGSMMLFSGTRLTGADSAGSWNTISIDDFLGRDMHKSALGTRQMEYLSARLLDAAQFGSAEHSTETSVLILEIDDPRLLSGINLRLGEGKPVVIAGEEALEQEHSSLMTLAFDEDRFVFIVTSDSRNAHAIAAEIIGRYPGPPTASRLFGMDSIPPRIFNMEPSYGKTTKSSKISFWLEDSESGIDLTETKIRGLQGLDRPAVQCKLQGGAHVCEMDAIGMKQGANHFEILAQDRAGNVQSALGLVFYDSQGPALEVIEPRSQWSSSARIVFAVEDQGSGIDGQSIRVDELSIDSCNISHSRAVCSLSLAQYEGELSATISAADNAGNAAGKTIVFFYDRSMPEIVIKDYLVEITDSGGLSRLYVNGVPYELGQCSTLGHTYHCPTDRPVQSAKAVDRAGNERLIYSR